MPGDVTVVVLAGGTSRRFGSDKLDARLRGLTVLGSVVGSLPARWPVVVVGPPRDCGRAVTWTREDPPGGGPLAGVAAGVDVVQTEIVAVVAGDMPFRPGPGHARRGAAHRPGGGGCGGRHRRRRPGQPAPRGLPHGIRASEAAQSGGEPPPAKLLLSLPHLEVAVAGPEAGTSTPRPTWRSSRAPPDGPARRGDGIGVGC